MDVYDQIAISIKYHVQQFDGYDDHNIIFKIRLERAVK